jgi:hypothetical protein
MILSGAQSTAAGIAFVLGGLSGKLHTKDMGGYAIFGAIYFLIGGILLSRKLFTGRGGTNHRLSSVSPDKLSSR